MAPSTTWYAPVLAGGLFRPAQYRAHRAFSRGFLGFARSLGFDRNTRGEILVIEIINRNLEVLGNAKEKLAGVLGESRSKDSSH
jgi:hypothetical protein